VNGFPCTWRTPPRTTSSPTSSRSRAPSPAPPAPWSPAPPWRRSWGSTRLPQPHARIDYAPGGFSLPHTHPRATELIFVLYGTLDVGFVTTAPTSSSLRPSPPATSSRSRAASCDIPVEPRQGARRRQLGVQHSQLAGMQSIAMTLFGASSDVVAKAFQIGNEEVDMGSDRRRR
jgi:hypothetical protein